MENIAEFEIWLARMLSDAKRDLKMTDSAIAFILFREATAHYFKTLQCPGCADTCDSCTLQA